MIPRRKRMRVHLNASQEAQWEKHFCDLLRFRRKHGHCDVSKRNQTVPGLYSWVAIQRAYKREGMLRPERERRLEEMGFCWDSISTRYYPIWERWFAQLVEFHQAHGHFEIPRHGPSGHLYIWANQQRHLQCLDVLRPQLRQRLEAIGFPWINPLDYSEQAWNRNFAKLVEFHRVNGRFRVKYREHTGLHTWITTQRILKRLGRLRPDREQRLEAAGFPWKLQERKTDKMASGPPGWSCQKPFTA
jgi:hypothetical protein